MEDFNWPDFTASTRGVSSCDAVVFDSAVNLRLATTGPDLTNREMLIGYKNMQKLKLLVLAVG